MEALEAQENKMKERPIIIKAKRIDSQRIEVKGVIFYAKDEVDAVRKYPRKKKPSEVKNEHFKTNEA